MRTELEGAAAQYAQAVFELAVAAGSGDQVESDLAGINQVMEKVPDFKLILDHPGLPAKDKKNVVVAAFKSSINELTLRLIELLCDRRRLELLPGIEVKFRNLMNEKKNIVSATLTCSQHLSDEAVANIKSRLTEYLGKKLDLHVKVDQSLIGGVILRLGDQVIDGSIKGKLRALEKVLLSV